MMERRYEMALDRMYELEERYMDLKAEYELLKDENKELNERVLDLTYDINVEESRANNLLYDLIKIKNVVKGL